MKSTSKKGILALAEGAAMVALAIALDLIAAVIPFLHLPTGGSITVATVPLIYYAYRHGTGYGLLAGVVWTFTQLLTGGFYVPPAGTVAAIVACFVLDYLIAFSAVGLAPIFARLGGRRRLLGYAVGAVAVNAIRYLSSSLSGALLWGSYTPEGMSVLAYTFGYNALYMVPNAILAGVLIVPLCMALDPTTLRRMAR